MKVDTSVFRNESGHNPRGYGLWFFTIERRPGEFTSFQITAKYADAVKAAKAEARQIGGASGITLQP
jgi:hypothetical protein